MSLHEDCDGLIVIGGAWRMKEFLRHAPLGLPRKKWRQPGWKDFCRYHEHQAIRHFDQAAVRQNVSLAVGIVRADELVAQAKSTAEIGSPGFFCDERIRARFDDASVNLFGPEDSTQA